MLFSIFRIPFEKGYCTAICRIGTKNCTDNTMYLLSDNVLLNICGAYAPACERNCSIGRRFWRETRLAHAAIPLPKWVMSLLDKAAGLLQKSLSAPLIAIFVQLRSNEKSQTGALVRQTVIIDKSCGMSRQNDGYAFLNRALFCLPCSKESKTENGWFSYKLENCSLSQFSFLCNSFFKSLFFVIAFYQPLFF